MEGLALGAAEALVADNWQIMKKLILTFIVLAVIGGGTYAYYKNKGTPEPTVTTLQITRGDIADVVQATGTLQAVETVNVGTQVSGVVQELHADFNSIVKRGQVIARLDPSLIETAIEQREASVTRAEAEIERLKVSLADARRKLEQAKAMWDKQLIPRDQLETAELNVKTLQSQIKSSEAGLIQATADLNTQRVNLGHTIIKAPIDGIVIQRSVDQGQTVASSMNAPTLYIIAADLTKMQVLASIDEAEVGRMRPGQPVTFRVDAFPTETFHGTVTQVRLQPTTVQNVVTYSTVIDVPNPQYKLKPGMTANVTIEVARRDDVLRAPAAALRFRPTNDMFAALKQEVPPDLQRAVGGFGARGGPGQGGNRGQDGTPGQAPGGAPQVGPSQAPANAAAQTAQTRPEAQRERRADTPENRRGSEAIPGGGERRGGGQVSEGSGRGNLANMTPEEREARRKQMEERMRNMSPEERERWEARMREGRGGRGGGPGTPGRGPAGAQSGRTPGGNAPATGIAATNATTIDALFAPVQISEGRGRLWLYVDKKLKMVNVRTGISDGTWTEIVDDGEAQLQTGTEVVTNIVTGLEAQARPGQQNPGSNPLMGPQRGGQRGGPGGGGGGRGGGR